MKISFKENVGIPLPIFQSKLSRVLNLIGTSVNTYPSNSIKLVFAAPIESEREDIESYFFNLNHS